MKDIFDLFAEGYEEVNETDEINGVLESVVIEEAINMIDVLSEGAIAKIGLKLLTKKERQEKMISGKPVNSATSVTYDIADVDKEIKAVEWYLKYGKKNLTDEQETNLKAYLPKLKNRYNKLGGRKALDKLEAHRAKKKLRHYAGAKMLGLI